MIQNDAQGNTTGYHAGNEIKLIRNPNWDHSTDYKPAYLDSIDVREGNKDTTVASRQVLSGSHMASGEYPVPGPVIKQALQSNKDQIAFVPTGGIDYIPLNTAIPPFDDINVRKAAIAGFDREAIRLTQGGKVRGPLATHFIPPSLPGFQQGGGMKGPPLDYLANPSGDPALAASYFKKAGMASGKYEGDATLFLADDRHADLPRRGRGRASATSRSSASRSSCGSSPTTSSTRSTARCPGARPTAAWAGRGTRTSRTRRRCST